MYLNYYGLTEEPFNNTPDPDYFFMSPSHREALASLAYTIQMRKGFASVIGEVGSGKTTLLRVLLSRFTDSNDRVRFIYIFNPHITYRELLELLLLEVGLETRPDNAMYMLRQFQMYLLKRHAAGKRLVVVVDEAQHMPLSTLEDLRMLTNLETAKAKLLQLILVGQPELEGMLNRPELRQMKQRIAMRALLQRLTRKESLEYIDYRLQRASNRKQPIFSHEALQMIADFSQGVPRIINSICDNALVAGFGYKYKEIPVAIIREVINDFEKSVFEA